VSSSLAPDPRSVDLVITAALAEDVGRGDVTSLAVLDEKATIEVAMRCRENIVVAGIDIAAQVFARVAPQASIEKKIVDGTFAAASTELIRLRGPARGILTAERSALNIVQFFSGIATTTKKYVDAIQETNAVLLDTRKTVPGLRALSKYATRMGGAQNHRMRLDDGVLIKDNHIAVAGSVGEAVRRALAAGLEDIEVECDTIEQAREALNSGAKRLLLDNMSVAQLSQAVDLARGVAKLEASGGVTLDNIRAIAKTGVDFISVGRITQSAPAVDIGLDLLEN